MDRKEKCEQVILTRQERRLLWAIRWHPHKKCKKEEVRNLEILGLVKPDVGEIDAVGRQTIKDTYYVSPFYWVYRSYIRTKYRDMLLSSFWMPFFVSVITSLLTTAPQWLPELLQQMKQ